MGNCNCINKDNQNFELKTEKTKSTNKPVGDINNDDEKLITSAKKIQSYFRRKQTRSKLKAVTTPDTKLTPQEDDNMLKTSTPLTNTETQLSISDKDLQDLFNEYPPLNDGITVSIKPHFKYENNSLYYGEWNTSLDQRHGRGIQKWLDGSKYLGYWTNDHVNIRGKLIHSEGDYYEGEWVNDKAEGKGCYYHINGATYEGEWKADRQEGKGKETWQDGSVYEGNYKNGLKNGEGKFIWGDGSMYTGNFVDNNIQGHGVYIWKDSRSYDGEWANNKMEGKGTFTWPDNRKYIGEYKNDKKDGYGFFEWGDGRKYKGFWKNGKQHGKGELYFPKTKEWKSGLWENGKRIQWLDN